MLKTVFPLLGTLPTLEDNFFVLLIYFCSVTFFLLAHHHPTPTPKTPVVSQSQGRVTSTNYPG